MSSLYPHRLRLDHNCETFFDTLSLGVVLQPFHFILLNCTRSSWLHLLLLSLHLAGFSLQGLNGPLTSRILEIQFQDTVGSLIAWIVKYLFSLPLTPMQFLMGVFSYIYFQSFIGTSAITVSHLMDTALSNLNPTEILELYTRLGAYLAAKNLAV